MEWEYAVSKPMTVEGTFNVRDLGGYPTASGGKTKKGVFLRADGLHSLTEAGKKALLDYGVGCVVDLRTEQEVEHQPGRLGPEDGVDLYRVPLADGVASNGFQEMPRRMGEMYVGLLENSGEKFAEIFRVFAAHPDCAALFHCAAGKDRTGVTAMLLLGLAGVPRSVIVADYAASYQNLLPLFRVQQEQMRALGVEIPEYVMRSDPQEMELALDWLETNHGTAERYLRNIGVPPEALAEIRARLVEG